MESTNVASCVEAEPHTRPVGRGAAGEYLRRAVSASAGPPGRSRFGVGGGFERSSSSGNSVWVQEVAALAWKSRGGFARRAVTVPDDPGLWGPEPGYAEGICPEDPHGSKAIAGDIKPSPNCLPRDRPAPVDEGAEALIHLRCQGNSAVAPCASPVSDGCQIVADNPYCPYFGP